MGIHLAQEADPDSTNDHIWAATIWTFVTKLVVALSFALPLLWFPLQLAVAISVGWGLLVITVLSAYLAKMQNTPVLHVVTEHLGIAILVVAISHFIGVWVNGTFA
jgi:VIT1/CCC1 family predicted Fe2+/Mn2+ transporter